MSADLDRLARDTRAVYRRNAARFHAERAKDLVERPWLDRFATPLPRGARILDLGCGTGEPIAAHLARSGFRVTGVDSCPEMIAMARGLRPGGDWRLADMRGLDLGATFDGIVGWDSVFHLTRDEQRALMPRLARHLAPDGALLITVGPREGVVAGRVGGEAVHHASLSPGEYRARLAACGVTVTAFVAEDPGCAGHSVLLARKGRAR